MGGLASQLHKYAIARSLSLKNNTELKLDILWFDSIPKKDTARNFKLEYFNIDINIAKIDEINNFKPNRFLIRFINKFNLIFKKEIFKFNHYSNKSQMSLEYFNKLDSNLYIEGEWMGYNYFNDIKEILQKELTLKSTYVQNANYFLSKQNKNYELISLHVRRGDFVHNSEASKLHCACSKNYYKEAIYYMMKKLNKIKILVFSDDIQWVKDNFDFFDDIDFEFIEGFSDYEEFYLMTQCRHNIIANSGFSWFSSWLNINPDKIIISPKNWVFEENMNKYIVDNIKDDNILFLDNIK